ncbi:alpha/beta hydrolase [Myxococcota bacterium]|nr:alpha/beta hydrolase [Myxococcota bacterium]
MNAFFFGRSDRSLFGAYHPPQGRVDRRAGIVLCSPMGQEYMRSHRAFRQLANLLSRKGYHVLRFDWFGTGDSMGASVDFSIGASCEDLEAAIIELRENADLERVSLIGLRLGASLAVLGGAERPDIERIILWDPVVSGGRYLATLVGDRQPKSGETVGALGFPITGAMSDELSELALSRLPTLPTVSFSIFVSEENEEYEALKRDWRGAGIPFEYSCVPAAGNWNEVDNFGSALVPQELIGSIVASFSEGASR